MYGDVDSEGEMDLSMPPPPMPAVHSVDRATAKSKARGKAAAKKAAGKPSGRNTYEDKMCIICEANKCCKKNPFCPKCKTDVDAAKKDAQKEGWTERFDAARPHPVLFRKLINDYREACPSEGAGKKRAAYSKARAIEITSVEALSDEGARWIKMDWFEFDAHYRKKNLSPSDISQKWKARLLAEGAYDTEGENADYPERLLVKKEDYVDAKSRKKKASEILREIGNDKKLLEQEVAAEHLAAAGSAASRWDPSFFGEAGALMQKAEQATGSRQKSRRLSGQSATSEDKDKDDGAASDLMVSRLRAYEEAQALFEKTVAAFRQTQAKINSEAGLSFAT